MVIVNAYGSDGDGRDVSRYFGVELHETEPGHVEGRAPVRAHLLDGDRVHVGALLTAIDTVGGICGGLAALPDGWVVSTNLAARVVGPARIGPLRIDAEVLRRGRHNVVTAVRVHDEGAGDALVSDAVLTSSILVPENGPPEWQRPLALVANPPRGDVPALREWLGVRAEDAAVAIDITDELRNPWGILHGGVVATLIDLAAANATGGETVDVMLHFLAPNRVGPVRAHARPIGTRTDGTVVRVEVRDAGADRVTALAVATARA